MSFTATQQPPASTAHHSYSSLTNTCLVQSLKEVCDKWRWAKSLWMLDTFFVLQEYFVRQILFWVTAHPHQHCNTASRSLQHHITPSVNRSLSGHPTVTQSRFLYWHCPHDSLYMLTRRGQLHYSVLLIALRDCFLTQATNAQWRHQQNNNSNNSGGYVIHVAIWKHAQRYQLMWTIRQGSRGEMCHASSKHSWGTNQLSCYHHMTSKKICFLWGFNWGTGGEWKVEGQREGGGGAVRVHHSPWEDILGRVEHLMAGFMGCFSATVIENRLVK